ncbi:hypothetical protein KEM48_013707 [Puccinia striiformis f. sp. tritici PST-130]|nr:hypothetical protein KEM48_013707 [Puccinia striiformis f. sp. tritici PST-130]
MTKLLFETPGWKVPTENINKQNKNSKRKKKEKTQTQTQNQELEQPSTKRTKTDIPSKQSPSESKPSQASTSNPTNELAKGLLNSNLNGSRFRILNETLYTTTGPEALQLFQSNSASQDEDQTAEDEDNPNFSIYHLGFRSQTKHWPQNPVNLIAQQLQQDYHNPSGNQSILIADLGCGEAPLAKLLSKSESTSTSDSKRKKSSSVEEDSVKFKVFSYDLKADNEGWITVAECSSLVPLPGSLDDRIQNGLMDVVVCCLSLMSTNWVGIILEARRILKSNGELRIAEVTSRFIDVDLFISFIKSIGFSNPTKDQSNTHFILFKFKKLPLIKNQNHPSAANVNLMDPKSKLELIQTGQNYSNLVFINEDKTKPQF